MSDRLTPERESEIAAAVAELDADRTLSFGTWTASPVTEKSTLPPEQAFAVEDVARLGDATLRGSVGVFGDERHAAFTAMARTAVPALLAELAAVRAERDQARRDAELQRAAYFHEAARLLESTGKDDDAVNLLDNMAAGIRTQAEDQNDNRHRIYIDGKGNGWISVCADEGTEWVVPVQPAAHVEQDVRDVADETGSLREIGRCW